MYLIIMHFDRKSVLPYALLHFADTLLTFEKLEFARDVGTDLRLPETFSTS